MTAREEEHEAGVGFARDASRCRIGFLQARLRRETAFSSWRQIARVRSAAFQTSPYNSDIVKETSQHLRDRCEQSYCIGSIEVWKPFSKFRY